MIVFIGFAYKPKASTEGDSISDVIAQLIRLATLSGGNTTDTKMEEISEAARSSLNRLLGSMSVVNFMQAVETMLDSGDGKVCIISLYPFFLSDLDFRYKQEPSSYWLRGCPMSRPSPAQASPPLS